MSSDGCLRWIMNSMVEGQVGTIAQMVLPCNSVFKFCGFFFAAFCDVTPYLKCYSWAVKECQRYGEKWNKKWAHEPTLIRVSAEVPEIMAHHATPVNSELYPTWDRFLQDFLKRGQWIVQLGEVPFKSNSSLWRFLHWRFYRFVWFVYDVTLTW